MRGAAIGEAKPLYLHPDGAAGTQWLHQGNWDHKATYVSQLGQKLGQGMGLISLQGRSAKDIDVGARSVWDHGTEPRFFVSICVHVAGVSPQEKVGSNRKGGVSDQIGDGRITVGFELDHNPSSLYGPSLIIPGSVKLDRIP
jgi:hypothetical protein